MSLVVGDRLHYFPNSIDREVYPGPLAAIVTDTSGVGVSIAYFLPDGHIRSAKDVTVLSSDEFDDPNGCCRPVGETQPKRSTPPEPAAPPEPIEADEASGADLLQAGSAGPESAE